MDGGLYVLAGKLNMSAYARASLYPSRWNEPFGLVMIESLACGTPVLALGEGAAPEVVMDGVTGRLCEDEADMADALAAIDRVDRAACRADVEARFSTARMAREHAELFERVLSSRA